MAERKTHPVLTFLGKFWGLSEWMLELILSAVLRKYADLTVVGALLVLSRRCGGCRSERVSCATPASNSFQRETWSLATSSACVPVTSFPADVKLITGTMSVDQSALTGESVNADKASGDMLSSGAIVS